MIGWLTVDGRYVSAEITPPVFWLVKIITFTGGCQQDDAPAVFSTYADIEFSHCRQQTRAREYTSIATLLV